MNCCSTILLIRQLEAIRVGLNLGMLPLSLQKKSSVISITFPGSNHGCIHLLVLLDLVSAQVYEIASKPNPDCDD